jgi:2-methylcitrate dehydratase PrpD
MERDRETRDGKENDAGALTRRGLLQGASCFLAAAAFPAKAALAAPRAAAASSISVMPQLSSYMGEARNHELPAEVVEKAKHHILDTFAAMVSGSELPPGRAGIRLANAYGGEKIATVVYSQTVCGPIEAAMANGMLAHSDETDDSHAPSQCHPGCSIVPAAFAAGEKFGINGTQFLRAVTLGYDIGPRVTMTLGGGEFQTITHRSTHSIAGTFGSAAAAGCAASLSAQQMRWLMDYAAQEASGVAAWQRDTDHVEKSFVFAGGPASKGVTAALVVQLGWTGIDDIFSGEDNFLIANAPQANPEGLIDKLGERYEVTQTNIKKWTVGSPIQAPLDALQNIMKKHPFQPDQVKQVIVRVATREAAVVDNRTMPDICLQHMIAVMLIDKTASFRSAHDKARMKDPAILRERAKVQLVPDEALEKLLPRREATVEVTLTDGTQLVDHVNDVRGTAQNPMTREEVVAKARDLMDPLLGAARCSKFVDQVLAIENLKDVRDLRPLLQRA